MKIAEASLPSCIQTVRWDICYNMRSASLCWRQRRPFEAQLLLHPRTSCSHFFLGPLFYTFSWQKEKCSTISLTNYFEIKNTVSHVEILFSCTKTVPNDTDLISHRFEKILQCFCIYCQQNLHYFWKITDTAQSFCLEPANSTWSHKEKQYLEGRQTHWKYSWKSFWQKCFRITGLIIFMQLYVLFNKQNSDHVERIKKKMIMPSQVSTLSLSTLVFNL